MAEFIKIANVFEVLSKDTTLVIKSLNGETFECDLDSVSKLFVESTDFFTEEKIVNKTDLQNLFHTIQPKDLFTVCFTKQEKMLSKKQIEDNKSKQLTDLTSKILKAKKDKKNVTNIALEALREAIDNPVLDYVDGEERVLKGFKINNELIGSCYRVFDFEKKDIRNVNPSSILWIIHNGIKYILK